MSLSFEVKSSDSSKRARQPPYLTLFTETALVKVGIVGPTLYLAPVGRMGDFGTTRRDPVS